MARGGFPGMGGANMQQMLKQAQKMQQDMEKLQADLETREVTATSGGGMVTVTVTGKREVKAIDIKPEAVDPDDVEMLQDLVLSAVNEALREMEKISETEMGKITGGRMPGGLF